MKIPYDSDKALDFNSKMMETIYLASVTASKDISKNRYHDMLKLMNYLRDNNISCPTFYSKEFKLDNEINLLYHKLKPNKWELSRNISESIGSYSTFEGSPFSQGILQFDMWDNTNLYYHDKWIELKEEVKRWGTRNSLLTALMPTASTSQILGNNECFEYFTNNIYTRKTQAGDFILVNKYLVNDLLMINKWDKKTKDIIIANNGSIQDLNMIPPEIKSIYKSIFIRIVK
jgi:ribonucleotide reductase alpha subunit